VYESRRSRKSTLTAFIAVSFLSEWFVARRGFANGVCFAGALSRDLFSSYSHRLILDPRDCPGWSHLSFCPPMALVKLRPSRLPSGSCGPQTYLIYIHSLMQSSKAGTTALLLGVSIPLLRPRIPVGRARSAGDDASKKDHPVGTGEKKKVWKSLRLWMFMLANGASSSFARITVPAKP
jgi:hypothetical protein